MKILFTFTGFNDPYAASVVEGGDRIGPVLSLVSVRPFDFVVLFATPGTQDRTSDTAALIKGPATTIRLLRLPDPTDYIAILRELRRECGSICEQYPNADLYVATASGTPQMHACWFLLTASGEIPATLLHIRPPKFVSKDAPQIEEIIPSAEVFPKVLPHRLKDDSQDNSDLVESALESIGFVVHHPSMKKLLERTISMATVDSTVLIQGETGTGKEMIARLLHLISRRKGLFVALNCGAIPNDLVESTLFGHVKGSFTGAVSDQIGKFEQATNGTLFLDEIGELPLGAQVKLLRVLQDKMIEPIGGKGSRKVDVRIVAATNRNLQEEVASKRFREDLYYRLCPLTINIPPLRQRRSEIVPIASSILERLNRIYRKQRRLSPEALRKLNAYDWPGNVRELDGVLLTATILATTDLIGPDDLQLGRTSREGELPEPHEGFSLETYLSETRQLLIDRALEISGGNQAEAARLLATSAQNINKHLKKRDYPSPSTSG